MNSVLRKKKSINRTDNLWLITYSDVVTLLLVFFVLIIAFSVVDQSKFEVIAEAIKANKFDGKKTLPFQKFEQELQKIIEKNDLEEKVVVNKQPLGVSIELSGESLFQSGEAILNATGSLAIKQLAKAIKNIEYPNYQVEIEGHTDDVPINNEKYSSNWELSVFRAIDVLKLLTEQGIPNDKFKIAGYGETKPKYSNETADGLPNVANRAKNRRIEINVFRKERRYRESSTKEENQNTEK